MTTTNINIRTDSELKAEAQSILADLGFDMSTAINAFLRLIVYQQGISVGISKTPKKTVKLGGWEDKIHIADNFNEPSIF